MRFISPSFLAFALLMSLFPWVEVRCSQPGAPLDYPVWHQNGWQAIVGDSTGGIPSDQELHRGGPNNPNAGPRPRPGKIEQKPPLAAAPLVGVCLGCTLAGTILGFALPMRRLRLILMGLLCCTALGTLITQMVVGFPLKEKKHDDILNFLMTLPPNELPAEARLWTYTSIYGPALYVTLAALFGAVIGVLVDALVPPRKRRPWEEDEDEDEDFDRPRRRRKRRLRFDEDDPPRHNRWQLRRDDDSP
jgi:hypothetical protein